MLRGLSSESGSSNHNNVIKLLNKNMIRSRLHEKIASLCAVITLCLIAAPAHAALVWVGNTTLPLGTNTFELELQSTEAHAVDGGLDTFVLSFSYSPATFVHADSALALASLPPSPGSGLEGWMVGGIVNDQLQVDWLGNSSAPSLPAGPLLKVTFKVNDPSASFVQQITATMDFTRIDLDGQVIDGASLSTVTTVQTQVVPEPSAWLLLAAGLAALGFCMRRRRT